MCYCPIEVQQWQHVALWHVYPVSPTSRASKLTRAYCFFSGPWRWKLKKEGKKEQWIKGNGNNNAAKGGKGGKCNIITMWQVHWRVVWSVLHACCCAEYLPKRDCCCPISAMEELNVKLDVFLFYFTVRPSEWLASKKYVPCNYSTILTAELDRALPPCCPINMQGEEMGVHFCVAWTVAYHRVVNWSIDCCIIIIQCQMNAVWNIQYRFGHCMIATVSDKMQNSLQVPWPYLG